MKSTESNSVKSDAMQKLGCEKATTLLGKFLAGETLPKEIQELLEVHVAGCDQCKDAIETRKESLLYLLDEEIDETAPVNYGKTYLENLKNTTPKTNRKKLLLECLTKKRKDLFGPKEKPAPKIEEPAPPVANAEPTVTTQIKQRVHVIRNWKPLTVSAALAIAMILMGHVASDPTALFGEKVVAPTNDAKKTELLAVDSEVSSSEGNSQDTQSVSLTVDDPDLPENSEDKSNTEPCYHTVEANRILDELDPTPLKYMSRSAITDYALNQLQKEFEPRKVAKKTAQPVEKINLDNQVVQPVQVATAALRATTEKTTPVTQEAKPIEEIVIKKEETKAPRKKKKTRRESTKSEIKVYDAIYVYDEEGNRINP